MLAPWAVTVHLVVMVVTVEATSCRIPPVWDPSSETTGVIDVIRDEATSCNFGHLIGSNLPAKLLEAPAPWKEALAFDTLGRQLNHSDVLTDCTEHTLVSSQHLTPQDPVGLGQLLEVGCFVSADVLHAAANRYNHPAFLPFGPDALQAITVLASSEERCLDMRVSSHEVLFAVTSGKAEVTLVQPAHLDKLTLFADSSDGWRSNVDLSLGGDLDGEAATIEVEPGQALIIPSYWGRQVCLRDHGGVALHVSYPGHPILGDLLSSCLPPLSSL